MKWSKFNRLPDTCKLSTFAVRTLDGLPGDRYYVYSTAFIDGDSITIDDMELTIKNYPSMLDNYEWLDTGVMNGRDEESSIAKLRNKMGNLSSYFEFKKIMQDDNLDIEKKTYLCKMIDDLESEILNQHWDDIIKFIKNDNNW